MAEQREEIIFDVRIDTDEAVNRYRELQEEIDETTKTLNEQTEAFGKNSEQAIKTKAQLSVLKGEQKQVEKQIQNNLKADREYSDSLVGLRQRLAQLTSQYDNLSKEQRDNADVGGVLRNQINELTDEIKSNESATQRFQRNVGNYPKVFDLSSTSMGKLSAMFNQLSGGTNRATDAAKGLTGGLKAVGKQMLALLANPIVAVISAVVVVVKALADAFKKNDDAMTSLQVAFAAFQPVVDVIRIALEKLVQSLTRVIEGFASAVRWVMNLIPAFRDLAAAEEDVVRSTDRLEESERQYVVGHAKRQKEINELRSKATEADKYSYKERLGFINQAIELEREDLDARVRNAKEKYRIAKLQAQLDRDTSDETKNNLAQLEAAIYQAEAEYNSRVKELYSQRASFMKAEADQARAVAKARREAADKEAAEAERREKEEEARRERERVERMALLIVETQKAEDAINEIIDDAYDRRRAAEKTDYERQKAALEQKMNLVQNDFAIWNAYYVQLEALTEAHEKRMSQIEKEEQENRRNQTIAASRERIAIAREEVRAFGEVGDNLADIFESLTDNQEASARLAKVIGLAKVAINQGVAISEAVAANAATPNPAVMIAKITASVTAILSTMAEAIASIKSAKFATGGIVPGTSFTGDRVPAMLNSREMVLNLDQQSNLFDMLNRGQAADYTAMAEAMSEALRNNPPRLVYSEFNDFIESRNRNIKISEL